MNRRLICLSQGEFGLTGKITDPELWCEGFLFCCTDLIFSLSLSALRDAEVSMRWVGPRCNGCTLMESAAVCTGPQTTGPRHAEAGAREQNLRRVSLYAALQCSSVNRLDDAIGDPRVKTPVRCQECGDWVPGRSVSAAILQLGNGWRIGTFVGHRNVTKHSWPPLAGVLSLLSPPVSPRVAVLVQLATLCKLRQSYQCAGSYRAPRTSVPDPDLSKTAVFRRPSTSEIYKHSLLVAQSRTSFSDGN